MAKRLFNIFYLQIIKKILQKLRFFVFYESYYGRNIYYYDIILSKTIEYDIKIELKGNVLLQ